LLQKEGRKGFAPLTRGSGKRGEKRGENNSIVESLDLQGRESSEARFNQFNLKPAGKRKGREKSLRVHRRKGNIPATERGKKSFREKEHACS